MCWAVLQRLVHAEKSRLERSRRPRASRPYRRRLTDCLRSPLGHAEHEFALPPAGKGVCVASMRRLPSGAVRLRGRNVGLFEHVGRSAARFGRPGDGRRRQVFSRRDVGPPSDPAWARPDPTVNVAKLVANNTRLCVYCGNGALAPGDTAPNAGALSIIESQAIGGNLAFFDAYVAGGKNATFTFPDNGIHDWPEWGCTAATTRARLAAHARRQTVLTVYGGPAARAHSSPTVGNT